MADDDTKKPNQRLFEEVYQQSSGHEDLSHLFEMSNFQKVDTGLPVNIWIDDTKAWKRTPHGNRIKFQGDTGNNVNSGNLFTMSTEDTPEIFGDTERLKLNSKQIKAIKQFVRNNKEIILLLGERKIGLVEFARRMIPNK